MTNEFEMEADFPLFTLVHCFAYLESSLRKGQSIFLYWSRVAKGYSSGVGSGMS